MNKDFMKSKSKFCAKYLRSIIKKDVHDIMVPAFYMEEFQDTAIRLRKLIAIEQKRHPGVYAQKNLNY